MSKEKSMSPVIFYWIFTNQIPPKAVLILKTKTWGEIIPDVEMVKFHVKGSQA